MHKRFVALSVAALLTATASAGWALADGMGGPPSGGPRWAHEGGPGRRWAELSSVLNLTDNQKAQVKALFEAQRPAMKPLIDNLRTARATLRAAVHSSPFDASAVRTAAQNVGLAQAEITVARASLRSQITALLTPDQQSLLQKLRPLMHEGGPRRGFGLF